jgi:hypothetical protein
LRVEFGTVDRDTNDAAAGYNGVALIVAVCIVLGVARLSSIDLALIGALFSLSCRVAPDLCIKNSCAVVDVLVGGIAVEAGVDGLATAGTTDVPVLAGIAVVDVEFDGFGVTGAVEAEADVFPDAVCLDVNVDDRPAAVVFNEDDRE